jgi:hypothetical protein
MQNSSVNLASLFRGSFTRARVAVCVLGLAGFAATTQAEDLTPAKKADIQKLLQVTNAARMAEQMGSLMVQTLRQSLRSCTNCTPRTFEVIERETLTLFKEKMNASDGLMERMTPIYNKHFSHAEIQQLLAFYQSPLGKRLTAETPQLAQEGFVVGQQWGQALGPQLETRIKAALGKENLPMPALPSPASSSK